MNASAKRPSNIGRVGVTDGVNTQQIASARSLECSTNKLAARTEVLNKQLTARRQRPQGQSGLEIRAFSMRLANEIKIIITSPRRKQIQKLKLFIVRCSLPNGVLLGVIEICISLSFKADRAKAYCETLEVRLLLINMVS